MDSSYISRATWGNIRCHGDQVWFRTKRGIYAQVATWVLMVPLGCSVFMSFYSHDGERWFFAAVAALLALLVAFSSGMRAFLVASGGRVYRRHWLFGVKTLDQELGKKGEVRLVLGPFPAARHGCQLNLLGEVVPLSGRQESLAITRFVADRSGLAVNELLSDWPNPHPLSADLKLQDLELEQDPKAWTLWRPRALLKFLLPMPFFMVALLVWWGQS